MPHQDDNSDRPNTLPPPELDPTLNPLLGQNMGRWAEVYFTSAPDKREEAVLELLRTLEAEAVAHEAGAHEQKMREDEAVAPPSLTIEHAPAPLPSTRPQIAEDPRFIECRSCGQESRAHQRFCGMCGARLEKDAARYPQIGDPIVDSQIHDHQIREARIEERSEATAAPPAQRWDRLRPLEPPVEEPVGSGEFLGAHDGGTRESSIDFLRRFSNVPPRSNSSLYYVGSAVAIVILAVSYVAWRGGHAKSGSSQGSPQPPQTASETARTTVASAPIPAAAGAATPDSSRGPAAEPAGGNAGTNQRAEETAPAPELTTEAAAKTPTATFSGNGSEELATAQRYLNGTDGQQRDPAEAVNWLWKAVAKRNTEATLLLADLFVKGNVVPQNCDQGRVLLDAAASRGSKDAAERLRHLQAFGCQ